MAKEIKVGLGKMLEVVSEYIGADEVLIRKVSKMGNSGHISVPKKHIGKYAKVIILKNSAEVEKE